MIMQFGLNYMKDDREAMIEPQRDARMAHDLGGFLDHLLYHGIDVSISKTELPNDLTRNARTPFCCFLALRVEVY